MARGDIGRSVEGLHAVAAAVEAGRVAALSVSAGRVDVPEVATVVEQARAGGAEVTVVDDVTDLAHTDAHQGLVARAHPIQPVALVEAVSRVEPAALVVLDHLDDQRNVGAIARSALAAGFGGIVAPTRRAAPLGAATFKAAAGALERLAIVTVSSVADAVAALQRIEVWTVALGASGDRSLFGLDLLAEPVAIVVGAEGRGVSRLVADRADLTVRIPLAGGVESLNASVAGALAVYETARVRGWV